MFARGAKAGTTLFGGGTYRKTFLLRAKRAGAPAARAANGSRRALVGRVHFRYRAIRSRAKRARLCGRIGKRTRGLSNTGCRVCVRLVGRTHRNASGSNRENAFIFYAPYVRGRVPFFGDNATNAPNGFGTVTRPVHTGFHAAYRELPRFVYCIVLFSYSFLLVAKMFAQNFTEREFHRVSNNRELLVKA